MKENYLRRISIKSEFVTEAKLMDAIKRLSNNYKRAVIVEPPDLDGFFKVKIYETEDAIPNN